jgi:hypothetical protein
MKERRYHLCAIQIVADTICARYNLCPIQFVPNTICARYNLCRYNLCRYKLCRNNLCRYNLYMYPSPTKCTVYTDSVYLWGGGWGVMNCTVHHILQKFYTLFPTRFRTYKIASPPQTKMTSKDDIKGLVSLKFLRPWFQFSYIGQSFAPIGLHKTDAASDWLLIKRH